MDRFASNTLRTLAIIVVAICILLTCGALLLCALCFGSIANMNHQADPGTMLIAFVFGGAALAVLIAGIIAIAALAKGYVRDAEALDQPIQRSRLILPTSSEVAAQFKELLPPRPQPRQIDVATHLSPASSTAIQQLAMAIAAKITAEVVLGIVGWYGALGAPLSAPFPVYRVGFMAWGLAAIAPHILLLYVLARRPGRTAFAYALVIPSIHILFGLFGHSAFLAFILRAGQVAAPLLSVIPWIIDILILYLAWRAIRLTGLLPDPPRLVVAAVVIFVYTSILPTLVVLLNYFHSRP
jgi:hypothetical protein